MKQYSCALKIRTYLLIYKQTGNDGRPRPEKIISNAKVNKIGKHTHKTLQREATVYGQSILKGWVP